MAPNQRFEKNVDIVENALINCKFYVNADKTEKYFVFPIPLIFTVQPEFRTMCDNAMLSYVLNRQSINKKS